MPFEQPSFGGLLFDLRQLSAANFARHRPWRAASLVLVFAVAAGFGYLAYTLVAFGRGHPILAANAYLDAGVLLAVTYGLLVLTLYPFRFWGRPPSEMKVDSEGLTFLLANGTRKVLPWADDELRVDLFVRPSGAKVPLEARYRLFCTGGMSDIRRPWRRVVPLVYVSEEAASAVIETGRRVGFHIKEEPPDHQPFSLVSGPGRFYRIRSRSD
jgi:hypothetical protein